ncbi:hypothetical protein DPMN_133218 [Dreissena polymorpha]|uniref:Uncharacterized protein n=1 Tax=Dreissena polymorpha TaxID=45954 RepID=A0A9D4FTU9_DREPO|nr:hypothetical protein DPMN_133218 [Dreissena polymorpha]
MFMMRMFCFLETRNKDEVLVMGWVAEKERCCIDLHGLTFGLLKCRGMNVEPDVSLFENIHI